MSELLFSSPSTGCIESAKVAGVVTSADVVPDADYTAYRFDRNHQAGIGEVNIARSGRDITILCRVFRSE